MKKGSETELNRSLRLVAASSVIVFIGIFCSKLFTYLYRVIIARQLGPEMYGIFSLSITVLSFFVMFASLGLTDGLVRYVSYYRGKKDYDKVRYVFRKVLSIVALSSIAGGIVLFFSSEFIAETLFHNEKIVPFLRAFSILVPFSVLSSIYLGALQAFEKVTATTFISNFLQNFLRLLSFLALIAIGLTSSAIILSHIIGIACMLMVAYFVSRKYTPLLYEKYMLDEKNKKRIKREVFSYSWPVIFTGGIYSLFSSTDSFILGYFKSVTDVGFYNAAFTLVTLFGIAPELFKQLFFPLVVQAYSKKNINLVRELSKQVSKWIFILNLPLFFIIFLYPGAVLNLIFGPEYLVAENALKILSLGALGSSFITVCTNLLSMKGRTKLILSNIALFTVLNVVLNIALVQRYGLEGVAFATAVSWILMSIALFLEVRYITSIIPLRRKMAHVLIASIFSLIVLISLKNFLGLRVFALIVSGIGFFITYLVFILLMRCLDKNDWMIIRSFKNKILSS